MKIVKFKSKDTKETSAALLLEGEDLSLLYLPPMNRDECPCLVFAKEKGEIYIGGNYGEDWTNIDFASLKTMLSNLTELVKKNGKIVDKKEYELYLKLKKKYNN